MEGRICWRMIALIGLVLTTWTDPAAGAAPASAGGIQLTLFTEPYQGAFHLLVPTD